MSSGVLSRVRRPEYTGENRCLPCTLVNVVIAVAVALPIGYVAPFVGIAVLVLALAAIALRGYLVPGTPTLTARYLPDRVHRLFEHAPDASAVHERDLEGTLVSWGVLEECADEDDLCLRASIRERFEDRLATLDGDEVEERDIAIIYDSEPEDVTRTPRYPPMVRYGGQRSEWPSEAALMADVAMAGTLSDEVPAWDETPLSERGTILAGLRPFLGSCPACDAALTLGEDVVRSCCRQRDVVRLKCTACDAALFEVDADDIAR